MLLGVCALFFSCFNKQANHSKIVNCFKNDTKARLSLGQYTMNFNEQYVDSALYYNNLSYNECSGSKKILQTRLDIFDLRQNYNACIKTINSMVKLDSVNRSEKMDLHFKKFTYYTCIDSVKYKDSLVKEYTYLLNQPKEWNDSLIYQYRLGLLEYQLYGTKNAMKRLSKFKNSNDFFVKGTVLNIENGNLQPLFVLVEESNIYHPLNDNRERAHIGN
jgi:hypothetical protein